MLILILFTLVSSSFSIPIDPSVSVVLCQSCTTVTDGVYRQTNSAGATVVSFQCSTNSSTAAICSDLGASSIQAFTPNPITTCQTSQFALVCTNPSRLTLWGDSRSNPRVPDANRDYLPADYASLASNSDYFPKTSVAAASGLPDIFAYSSGDPLNMLLSFDFVFQPRPGTNDASNPGSYESTIQYNNFNPRLFLYTGVNVGAGLGNALTSGPVDGPGTFRKFYTYLTTHSKVTTKSAALTQQIDIVPVNFNPTDTANLLSAVSAKWSCSSLSCLLGTGFVSSAPSTTTTPVAFTRVKETFATNTKSMYQNTLFESPGAYFLFPSTTNAQSAVRLSYNFASQGVVNARPFSFVVTISDTFMRDAAILQVTEQSIDGTTWTPHPESVTPAVANLLLSGDLWGAINLGRTSSLCKKSNFALCIQPFYPTGENIYLRSSWYLCTNAACFATGKTRSFPQIYLLPNMLTSDERAPVSVYVTPSLAPPTTVPNLSTLGYSTCLDVPGCNFIPSTYGDTYPGDGVDSLHGSVTVQRFMNSVVMPLIQPCSNPIADPVKTFLTRPQIGSPQCLRFANNPTASTCYAYQSLSTPVSGVSVLTDSSQSFVTYRSGLFQLTVSPSNSLGAYLVPTVVIGPITPSSLTPSAYIYSSSVPGSYSFESRYIAPQEVCTTGPSAGALTQTSSCPCLPYPLSPVACLCTNLRQYRITQTTTPNVTFSAPQFMQPRSFPTSFKLTSSSIAYDVGVFTLVSLDCKSFLCSGNEYCLTIIDSTPYTEFCSNLNRILQTTLLNLRATTSKVSLNVNDFLSKNYLPPSTSLNSVTISNLPGSNPLSTPPLQARLRDYVTSARSLTSANTFQFSTSGYNYREPLTTPLEAFGLSIFPAVGVGILTEKINGLAIDLSLVGKHLQLLEKNFNSLIDGVSSGFAAITSGLADLSSSHNSLVATVNDLSGKQNFINSQIADRLNSLSTSLTGTQLRLSVVELLSARSSTLSSLAASIFATAADVASRGREFASRISSCSNPSTASAALCANVEGELVSTFVRTSGTITYLESLVLTANESIVSYAAAEFCYRGLHYISTPGYIFVPIDGVMYSSSTSLYAPVNISAVTASVLPRCDQPRLIVTDLTPGIQAVPIESTFTLQPIAQFSNISFMQLPISNATVDLTSVFNTLSNITSTIQALKVTPLTDDEVASIVQRLPSNDQAIAIAGVVIAVLALVGLILTIVYLALKSVTNGYSALPMLHLS